MNNFNNYLFTDKINSQLERADKQKRRLIRNIYKEYELYLSLLRELLYICVEKGLNELCSYESIKDHLINANDFFYPIEKKIDFHARNYH